MRATACLFTLLLALAAGCERARRYELQGQILAIDPARHEITVRHGDIKGFMPGMTMPFRVSDDRALTERKPGDLIKATLVVANQSGRLEDVVRTGEAPLPADLPSPRPDPPLEAGATVPDAQFLDQDARRRLLSEWRGKTVAVTFVYTRCPLPDFCPLIDRNFAAVQKSLAADRALAGRVHLLSVTFDPDHDSPEVLRAHAARAGSNPGLWTWLTGEKNAVDAFASRFGVSIIRENQPADQITHNLRTAIIDRDGRLVQILNGNEWTPAELVDSLRAADAR
jgi:protein SCO1/2